MGFLAGKRILITGLISNRSIAYGIAKACHREGASLAFTYQNERFRDRIAKFADGIRLDGDFPLRCRPGCRDRGGLRGTRQALGRP